MAKIIKKANIDRIGKSFFIDHNIYWDRELSSEKNF
jgi:hypothetical protein